MPMLDVTDVLLDPLFCEALVIYRRTQVIDAHGRVTVTPTLVAPTPYGVILPVGATPLDRKPEQQNLPRRFEVHTPYRLRSASKNPADTEQYQPDVLLWNIGFWYVDLVDDFSRFGAGFIRAEIVATDPIDVEPV